MRGDVSFANTHPYALPLLSVCLGFKFSKNDMKILKILGVILAGLIGVVVLGLVFIGSQGPETSVYLGRQVPKKYLKEVRELGLLERDEEIAYFYSDALLDIKEGLYFVSDRHLVLYYKDWEEPQTIIKFEDISNVEVEYEESFFEDSYVVVETIEGFEISFPLSSEKGRDKKFVAYIQSHMNTEDADFIDEERSDG